MSQKRACKVDANQTEIVSAFRKMGASVQILSAVGKGCPDILVGYRGVNYAVEIKDGDKVPSKRKLTPDQVVWHEAWQGQVCVVTSVEEACNLLAIACN